MDWANERYVRAYTRDTGDWLLWPWETRALLLFLFRKVDRSGLLHLGKGKLRALAAIVGMPEEEVAIALEPLLEDGCVQLRGDKLAIPNFMKAQETPQSDKLRKQESRERAREDALGQDGHAVSHAVTPGHAESRLVTLSLAEPSQTEPSSAEPDRDTPAAPVREEPQSQTRFKSAPPIAMPGGDPEIRAVADAIQAEKRLHAIHFDAYGVAEAVMPVTLRRSVAAYREAVHDAAGETMPGEVAQFTISRVRRFLKAAKEPQRAKSEAASPAHKDFDFEPGELGPARARKRVTAQDSPPPPLVGNASMTALRPFLDGIGARPPSQPLTEAERDAKRLADKQRLREMDEAAERKAGAG